MKPGDYWGYSPDTTDDAALDGLEAAIMREAHNEHI